MAVSQRSHSMGYQINHNKNYYSSHNYNNSENLQINYSPMPSPSPGPQYSPTPLTYSSSSPNNNNYSYKSSNNKHQQHSSWNQQQFKRYHNPNMHQNHGQNHRYHNRSHSDWTANGSNYNQFNYQNNQMPLQQSSQPQISYNNVSAQTDPQTLFRQQARNNKNNQFASTGQLIERNKNGNTYEYKSNDSKFDDFEQTNQKIKSELKMRQQIAKQKLSENINPKKKLKLHTFVRKINEIQIIYESWLNKKGKINKAMQIRYCKVYNNGKLKYFKRADDKRPAGIIDLQSVFAINILLPKEKNENICNGLNQIKQDLAINIKTNSLKNNEFGFELVTNKRIWIFSCKNGNIFQNWMNVMKDLCFGKTIYSGYLMKIGAKYKTWKRRFFVIYDLNEMRYFETETLNVQKGKIDLNKVSKIVAIDGKKYEYPNCIELHTYERIWILGTNSYENRNKWMNVIKNVMNENEILFEFILPSNE